MKERRDRATAPLVGNILLVAVALVVAVVLVTLSFTFLENTGTPTAEAKFEYEQTPAGLEMEPVALGTDVVVRLNGDRIATFDADAAGQSVLLPTAPGDRITVVSRDEDRSVLVSETVDDRSEVGDFIAYYTFESGSGTTLVDRSGNGNDGELEDDDGGSGPSWAGCGLRFDGDDDYVSVTDLSSPVDTSAFTVAVAYEQTGNDDSINQLVEHQFAGSGDEWFLETTDAGAGTYRMDFAVEYPSEVVSSGETYALGSRHVVVGTYDGDTDTYRLYVDGDLAATGSHDRPVNMGDMRLGRDFESEIQYLAGDICQARLYYTAFGPGEVQAVTDAMD